VVQWHSPNGHSFAASGQSVVEAHTQTADLRQLSGSVPTTRKIVSATRGTPLKIATLQKLVAMATSLGAPKGIEPLAPELELMQRAVLKHDHMITASCVRGAACSARDCTTPGRTTDPFRAHKLRVAWVTFYLSNGRSETSVAGRAGHEASLMVNRRGRALGLP